MLTKDGILTIIKTDNVPYWILYVNRGIDYVPAGSYNLENLNDNANDEEKQAKSSEALINKLGIFPANTKFSIELRKTKQANGTSKLGPFEFTINENTPQNTQNFNGLGSVDFNSLGFVPKDQMQTYIDRALLERDKRDLERDKQEFEDAKKEEIKEIEQDRKRYNSNMEMAKDALGGFVGDIISTFVKVKGNPVAALGRTAEPVEETVKDFKTSVVEKIAGTIYEQIPEQNIESFQKGVNALIEKYLQTLNEQKNAISGHVQEATSSAN